MPSDLDIAWAAGLYEGEGSAMILAAPQCQPRVALNMTDEDVVRRFAAIFGRGNVRRYEGKNGRLPQWQWSVQSGPDVVYVLALLWPHLGERRRERATEVMERALKIGEPRHGGGHKSTGFCKRGHDLNDPEHAYYQLKTGKRMCRTCRTINRRRLRALVAE